VVRTNELASRAEVNRETLRYYLRRGLLPEPGRSAAGYRSYPPEAVLRVRFIKRAQELGFTLAEIDTLLHLADGGPDSCDRVRAVAADKIVDLRQRIADLQALETGLTSLVATCDRPRPERDCPILHELGQAAQP
jgi:Hg(II)-responsive transcriptional regulator